MSKKNLKLKASDTPVAIDWAAVDASPRPATPDADSPELTRAHAAQLRPLREAIRGVQWADWVRKVIREGLRTA